jgi:hypothetical protein
MVQKITVYPFSPFFPEVILKNGFSSFPVFNVVQSYGIYLANRGHEN